MRAKLQEKLLRRFPVLYQEYYDPCSHTCMCWGFDVGDGWFDTVWDLSMAIEKELKYSWLQKKWFLFKKGFARRWNGLIYRISPPHYDDIFARIMKRVAPPPLRDKENYFATLRFRLSVGLKCLVWFPNTGFAVVQVKEKFGTLRFYTRAANNKIDDLVDAAERRSSKTCEVCGAPGKMRVDGWYKVRCDECQEIYEDGQREPNGLERAIGKTSKSEDEV